MCGSNKGKKYFASGMELLYCTFGGAEVKLTRPVDDSAGETFSANPIE